MHFLVKLSASLCFACLAGEGWGVGQRLPVHCCSWTQEISVLVLMQAQRCDFYHQ